MLHEEIAVVGLALAVDEPFWPKAQLAVRQLSFLFSVCSQQHKPVLPQSKRDT
jgi:hypothetical protein